MQPIYDNGLPTYENIKKTISGLKGRYPCIKTFSIGKSHLQKEIHAISIGDKDFVLLAGGFHSLEWITAMLMLRFAEDLCRAIDTKEELAGTNVTKAMKGKGVIIIPCVNPDGTEMILNGTESSGTLYQKVHGIAKGDLKNWQANANGVDINHNFDAGWHILREMEEKEGIRSFAPRQFGGIHPESEPETKAICDLCRKTSFRHAAAFHSQGEEIYWHYGRNTPEKSRLMAEIFASSSGYKPSHPDGLASHGGFKDWFIDYFKRPAFTIEVGKGKNPLPFSDFMPIYDKILEMLLLMVIM